MTVFDYLVLFILITSIIISTLRGLIKEMLSLLSWIVAFLVANAYGVRLAELIPLQAQASRLIVAFVALFIGVHLLMWLLSRTLAALIEASGLKLVDRGLGSLFGLARGCIIVLAVMLVCGMTSLPQQDFWQRALLRPTIEAAALTVKPFLPGNFARYVKF